MGQIGLQNSVADELRRYLRQEVFKNWISKSLSPGDTTTSSPLQTGWALSRPKSNVRFSQKAKEYPTARFTLGERTGRKADLPKLQQTCEMPKMNLMNDRFMGPRSLEKHIYIRWSCWTVCLWEFSFCLSNLHSLIIYISLIHTYTFTFADHVGQFFYENFLSVSRFYWDLKVVADGLQQGHIEFLERVVVLLTEVISVIADRMRDFYFPVKHFCQFLPISFAGIGHLLSKYTSSKRNIGQIKLIYICLQIALNLSVTMKNVILSTIMRVTNPLRGEEVVSVKQCSGSKFSWPVSKMITECDAFPPVPSTARPFPDQLSNALLLAAAASFGLGSSSTTLL